MINGGLGAQDNILLHHPETPILEIRDFGTWYYSMDIRNPEFDKS